MFHHQLFGACLCGMLLLVPPVAGQPEGAGPALSESTPVIQLVEILGSKKGKEVRTAAEVLFKRAPLQTLTPNPFLNALKNEHTFEVRRALLCTLCEIGLSKESLPVVVAALADDDPCLRAVIQSSMRKFAATENNLSSLTCALLDAIKDQRQPALQNGAAQCLAAIGLLSKSDRETLFQVLLDRHPDTVRFDGRIPLYHVPIRMKSKHSSLRALADAILHDLSAGQEFLRQKVESGDDRSQRVAAACLGPDALPVFRSWLNSTDLKRQQHACDLSVEALDLENAIRLLSEAILKPPLARHAIHCFDRLRGPILCRWDAENYPMWLFPPPAPWLKSLHRWPKNATPIGSALCRLIRDNPDDDRLRRSALSILNAVPEKNEEYVK